MNKLYALKHEIVIFTSILIRKNKILKLLPI